MDLLVTVDSMPAHMAGALGVPVWTLLGANADWRWMRDREDTVWYPGMRLYRQVREGDWESVVAKVAGELERFAQS
jgi:ADP-heptose:LPS heptosyltransferase